ncbi:Prx [Anthophora plagiata]
MEDEPRDTCFAAGSVAGAVIGTFLTTILLLLVAALLYRQWRRHKGKHLVLVTDPEIVEEAYAFDNPCFKDVTISSTNRAREGAVSLTSEDTSGKDTVRWSTSWTTLGLGSSNRNDKRKTLDDSCLGLKTTRINVVSLKSRDFTGLGFNICGNMREGIFVKDLLHRGPASESGRIHPGDRIASVKISFQNMVYEDALTILSYASPYDVKLEVESGGIGSKPTTLLKKTVGPSARRICHPLYRSQSIPEFSQSKSVAKRLFIVDPNESTNSNYSTMNSTLKSSKSTPSSQTFEKRHNEFRSNHHKFGIKVLPALDGTVQRIENQNEHNTNLERRHSKRLDAEKHLANVNKTSLPIDKKEEAQCQQSSQLPYTPKEKIEHSDVCNVDTLDKSGKIGEASIHIPSEVPTEVHNAAMAARRNRKNSSELLNTPKNVESIETEEPKSQQKSKRKAPPPPKISNNDVEHVSLPKKDLSFTKEYDSKKEDKISSIVDYTEPVSEQANKTHESTENVDTHVEAKMETLIIDGRHSESDTDSEIQNSFTTIELNSADITIHRTPVPETNDEDEDDDVYRKAASLGDLSKYECRTSTTLERAQSLDMTDTGTKKRKAPLPPEDINESTEDLTKLDRIDTFDRRLLKKSSEWGNLEDVVWYKKQDSENKSQKSQVRKKSNGSLERSKSAVEIKSKTEATDESREENFMDNDTSIELYNLPLSKRLTEEFIRTERMFNPDEDNSLARIVNDGTIVKSPTLEELELQFKKETSLPDDFNNDNIAMDKEISDEDEKVQNKDIGKVLKHFEAYSQKSPVVVDSSKHELKRFKNWKENNLLTNNETSLYAGKKPVNEEPMTKVTVKKVCPTCEGNCNRHEACKKKSLSAKQRSSTPIPLQNYSSNLTEGNGSDSMTINDDEEEPNSMSYVHKSSTKENDESRCGGDTSVNSRSSSKRITEVPVNQRIDGENDEDEDEYEFGSGVVINNKNLFDREDRRNINNISISSGENSEDSGLVGESMDYNPQEYDNRPPLPNTPMPQKMTYITEIKLPANRGKFQDDNENNETLTIMGNTERKLVQNEVKTTSNGKTASNKKPPVPPRRTDITKSSKKGNAEKQVIYVSEYKSNESKESDGSDVSPEIKQSDNWSAET